MFSQVSVCPQRRRDVYPRMQWAEGVCIPACTSGEHPPGTNPLGRHFPWADSPPRQTTPEADVPSPGRHPQDGYPTGMHSY